MVKYNDVLAKKKIIESALLFQKGMHEELFIIFAKK
jgi:hypothetical protein